MKYLLITILSLLFLNLQFRVSKLEAAQRAQQLIERQRIQLRP